MIAVRYRYMAGRDGIIVFFDKDRGAEIAIAAIGGTYLEVRSGEASGLAPLRGFENTPYARDCLTRWLRGLIETDGHGPLPPADGNHPVFRTNFTGRRFGIMIAARYSRERR